MHWCGFVEAQVVRARTVRQAHVKRAVIKLRMQPPIGQLPRMLLIYEQSRLPMPIPWHICMNSVAPEWFTLCVHVTFSKKVSLYGEITTF